MNESAPSSDISDVGRTSRCKINESTCASRFLEENQAIACREEDLNLIGHGAVLLNALSPVKQLPDDVLRHIFELVLCNDSLAVNFPRNHTVNGVWCGAMPAQIALSHVCSVWRKIIIDVPTFWSSIRIVPSFFDTPRTLASVVEAANTWLSRAKSLPCSIDIDFGEDGESWASAEPFWRMDWHENIIRDLISLHKFKKIGATFTDHHLRDLLQLPEEKLSCIEVLWLRYIHNDAAPTWDLHKLPNLTSFSYLPDVLYGTTFNYLNDPLEAYSYFTGFRIPWHNLRHLELWLTMEPSFCLDVLEHCSAVLETCSLVIAGDHTFTSSSRVPVHLSQLRQFEVVVWSSFRTAMDDEILEPFLLSLRFPGFTSLTLGSPEETFSLEMLLQIVKARSGEHGIEVTEFKSVTLHCSESEDQIKDNSEVLNLIEEIKQSGIDLNVAFSKYR